jgi:hypothetical protein
MVDAQNVASQSRCVLFRILAYGVYKLQIQLFIVATYIFFSRWQPHTILHFYKYISAAMHRREKVLNRKMF